MIYILHGRPVGIVKAREASHRRQWDAQAEVRSKFAVDLTEQHGDRPLFEGPLSMTAVFYFGFPQYVSQRNMSTSSGKPHVGNPGLSDLIQFFEWLAKGIVFSKDYIIASVDAKKCYDSRPRMEIMIEKIGDSWKK